MILLGQWVLSVAFTALAIASGLFFGLLGHLDGWGLLVRIPLQAVSIGFGLLMVLCNLLLVEGVIARPKVQTHYPKASYFDGADTGRRIVFLAGLGTTAHLTVRPILNVLANFGNVMVVDYPTTGYDEERMFTFLDTVLAGQEKVVLVGLSFGAMTIANYLSYLGENVLFTRIRIEGVVLMDGPTGWRDVKNPLIHLSRYLKASRLLGWVWPYLQRGFMKLQPSFREPWCDPELLKEHLHEFAYLPVEAYLGQFLGLYNNVWPVKVPAVLTKTRAAIIDCIGKDPLVKDSAVKKWEEAFPRHKVVEGLKGHCTTVEEPLRSREVFMEALDYVCGN